MILFIAQIPVFVAYFPTKQHFVPCGRGRGALTGSRAWTGCPDRRQSVSAAHALTDWQGNTDTARCTALVQRVGAARALTTGRQYARARFPIDRRGVLLYPVSIGLKRATPYSNPIAKQFRKGVRRLKNKIFQSRDLCLRALDTNSTCAKNVRRNERKR